MNNLKSLFDYSFSIVILLLSIFPLLVFSLLIIVTTKKSPFFKQQRIGRNKRKFYIYKLRTMKGEYKSSITTSKMEITPLGRFLRKYKWDEIPQVINILKGEMSWVGPRPDVPGYADQLFGEDEIILTVKPGITGPAQIKYRNEEELLSNHPDPIKYNDEVLWKDKVEINKKYVKDWSLGKDLKYLFQTFLK